MNKNKNRKRVVAGHFTHIPAFVWSPHFLFAVSKAAFLGRSSSVWFLLFANSAKVVYLLRLEVGRVQCWSLTDGLVSMVLGLGLCGRYLPHNAQNVKRHARQTDRRTDGRTDRQRKTYILYIEVVVKAGTISF